MIGRDVIKSKRKETQYLKNNQNISCFFFGEGYSITTYF